MIFFLHCTENEDTKKTRFYPSSFGSIHLPHKDQSCLDHSLYHVLWKQKKISSLPVFFSLVEMARGGWGGVDVAIIVIIVINLSFLCNFAISKVS